jgi:L-asparaginase
VLAVCAGTIHAGRHVQKGHTYRLDAFDSGDAGPLGYVEEGVVRLAHAWPVMDAVRVPVSMDHLAQVVWPRVEIVMNYVGATGSTVRALCAAPLAGAAPVRGVVVAGTGNGTVHVDMEAALREAEAAGVRVVRSSRCARGRVVAATVPGSVYTFAHSNGLPPVKARIALILELLA